MSNLLSRDPLRSCFCTETNFNLLQRALHLQKESAKSRGLRAHVLTCLAGLRTYFPTYLACLCAHVRTCLAFSSTNVLCMLTGSHAITSGYNTNNKNKFSITCFPQIFGTFSFPFSCEIKLLYIRAFLLTGRSL